MSLNNENTITLVVINDDGQGGDTLERARNVTRGQAADLDRVALEITNADSINAKITDPNGRIPLGVLSYRVIALTIKDVVAYAIAKGGDTSYVDLKLALAEAGDQSVNR